MKVYFLNPPFLPHFGRGARWQDTGRGGTLYYPVWLAYATAAMEQIYESRLADAPARNWDRDAVLEDIAKFKPDMVVLDTSFPSLKNDIEVASFIKGKYECKIALVGPPASQMAEKILKSPDIDFVARLEYDFILRELAEALDKKTDFTEIKGLSYKAGGKIIHNPDREFTTSAELDTIPFVSKVYKKHLEIKDYFLSQSLYPEVQIFIGRGCPNQCTFCAWPHTLMGRRYRVRSIQNVIEELEWVQVNLPEVKEVFFEDDTFTINRKIVRDFCAAYRKKNLKITWACNARADLDFETMQAMKAANCRLLIVGYESGNDQILKNIKKGISTEDIRKFNRDARKAGLLVHGDFIIGIPGETKETIRETRRLIKEIKPDILQISVATPFPGTEFYRWAAENNYLTIPDPDDYLDKQGHQKAIISYPWLTGEEMTREVDNILKSYYLSPSYLLMLPRQVFRKHGIDEKRRLWHSMLMFLRYLNKR